MEIVQFQGDFLFDFPKIVMLYFSGPAATATTTATATSTTNCKQFFSGLQIVYKHFCKLNKIFRGACGMWHVACNAGIPIAIATVGSNLEIQETPQQQQRQQQRQRQQRQRQDPTETAPFNREQQQIV